MRSLPLSFLLCLAFFARAQHHYDFKHLNIENGLSQSAVLAIAQDANGFIWFGTRFGLNKYNSRSFKVYQSNANDSTSLADSYVISLLKAKDGTLWVGTISGLNRYNENKDNFERFVHHDKVPSSISSNTVACIFQDSKARLWIGTSNGLNLWLPKKKAFMSFLQDDEAPHTIYTIAEDHNGTIWMGTSKGLMNMTITNGKAKFKFIKSFSEQINRANDNHVTSMIEDRNQNLWIGTKQTGLSKLNLATGAMTTYTYSSLNPNGICSNNIRKMVMDTEGKLWIATIHGINVYNPANASFATLQNEPENQASLSQNSVYDIFQDKQGIIWIGTYYGGINIVYPNYTPFKVYKSALKNGLSSNVVGPIIEDNSHNLWIGTDGEGLNYFDRQSRTYTHYKYSPNIPSSLSSNLVKAILKDRQNRIWVGTHLGGLNLFMPGKGFRRFTNRKNDPTSLSNNEITFLFEDSYARFWVGTNGGLNSFDPGTGKFRLSSSVDRWSAIYYVFEDSKRNIWVSSNTGLYLLKSNSTAFVKLKDPLIDKKTFSLDRINCITEDKTGNLLFGTLRKGLLKLNAKTKKYSLTTTKSGLPSDNIMAILEDKQQNLWISTDNGLCSYNPAKNTFKTYNIEDDLPGNEFNYRSALIDSKGEFFFGGLNGLISFFPSQIRANKLVPKAIFTDLKLFNKTVHLGDESGLLHNNISHTPSIVFNSDQNVFSIDFTILNFIKSDKNRYAYKLEGFEKNWNYVSVPSASYTNLSPGSYTLLVKGSNNDGVWTASSSSLRIKVLPPFYRTWWAYAIYAALLIGILLLLLRYLLVKALLRKEKEMNEHKLSFFTHISHEIRTPLTLIVGPLEHLIENAKDDPALNKELQPIKNNADRLMNLVTELLDFRKAETGKMTLQVSPGNMVKFSKEIFMAFQNMAIAQQIAYTFETDQDDIELYFDKMQLEKVLFNLLSNAFKFSNNGGKISVRIEQQRDWVYLHVTDNGKGIPADKKDSLFTDFYQANPSTNIGTGLGLSLSKSIVELHHGHIDFESTPQNEGKPGLTCFTISLQRGKAHFKPADFIKDYVYYDDASNYRIKPTEEENPIETTPSTATTASSTFATATTATDAISDAPEKKYSILLVEDNEEVRHFIKSLLETDYHVIEKEDGLQGWESALELLPDLIISDVMMPNMDGLELCRKLKTDERTSHIPVVLLTARSAYVHQVNGFENGADTYIMKPFNPKILTLNIHNLLQAREIIRQKFAQVITLEPQNLIINSTEQNFLNKTIRIIEDHIADPEFDVATLASEIGMSLPILYKKIRALTGLSVNDFIKSLRLKRADQLLKAGVGSIAEVAYSVGFNDRKYFSLEFKKQFGKSPTAYLDNLSKNGEA